MPEWNFSALNRWAVITVLKFKISDTAISNSCWKALSSCTRYWWKFRISDLHSNNEWQNAKWHFRIGIYLYFDSGRSYIKQMYHLHPFLSFLCANEIFSTLFHIIWIFKILLRLEMTFQMWKVFFEYRIKRDMTKIGVYRLKGNFQMNWATL